MKLCTESFLLLNWIFFLNGILQNYFCFLFFPKSEELDAAKLKKIEEYYEKSKEYKPEYYKTWHHFALLNFAAIDMTEAGNTDRTDYIINALEGFMRSISLGTSSEHKSPNVF